MKLSIPNPNSHKGQNGKLLVIGGSKAYSGAPMFSLLSARRFVDLLYFYPYEFDSHLITAIKQIPEVIVLDKTSKEVDCILFGVGCGQNTKFDYKKLGETKLVIDGDGLKSIKNKIPSNSILTPHEGEFQTLFDIPGTKENILQMAAENKCIIVKKGPVDYISDGKKIIENNIHNQGMTKGGTGDILSGLIAALSCKNNLYDAAVAGTIICGIAGNFAQKKFGFNFCASDLIEELPKAYMEFEKI